MTHRRKSMTMAARPRGGPRADDTTDRLGGQPLAPEGPTDVDPGRPGDGLVGGDRTPDDVGGAEPDAEELGALPGSRDGYGTAEPDTGSLTSPASRGVDAEGTLADDPLHTAAEEGFELDIPTESGFLDDRRADVGTPLFGDDSDPSAIGLDDIATPLEVVSDDSSGGSAPDVTSRSAADDDDDGVTAKPGADSMAEVLKEEYPNAYAFAEKVVNFMVAPPGSEKERQLAAAENDGDGKQAPTSSEGDDGAAEDDAGADESHHEHIDYGVAQQSAPAYEEKGFLDWLSFGSPASDAEQHWTDVADADRPPPGGGGTNEYRDPDHPSADPDDFGKYLNDDLLKGEAVADAATLAGDITPDEHADVPTDGAVRTYDPGDDFDANDNPLPPDPDDIPTLAEVVAPELGEGG
jgi:hypothetical protein